MPENLTKPELPDFEVLRQIGQGGYGVVWLARNRTTGKLVAVKLIRLHCTAGRADRELASLVRLEHHLGRRHDHLMQIHHVGRTDEYLYYVMDLADDVQAGRLPTRPIISPPRCEVFWSVGRWEPRTASVTPGSCSRPWPVFTPRAWPTAT